MAQKIKRKQSLHQRMKNNQKFQAVMTVVLPLMFGVVLIGLWEGQVLHTWFHTDTFALPLPSRICTIFGDNFGKIMKNVKPTMTVALIGLFIGSVFGYFIAVLAALFPKLGKGGLSLIGAFASIPVVALAPVMNNWTKDISSDASIRSMVAKIVVVTLISAANMSLNAYRGLTELKPYAEDLMATYAAKKLKTFTKLRLPNSVPYIFVALRVSVPASIMTTIVSEYFAEYITGVGRQIRECIVLAQYATAWAYIFMACILGIVMYVVLMITQSILLRRYH
ncbi:MAG: ABC transporter permease subunit [Eubacteriales bacterium]|nr:ABC transporter permease subunit [Eubacteriales bacterium]